MIQTVKGKINPSEMGITMSHEHLSIDLSPVRKNDDSTYYYSSEIINEVLKSKKFGVDTFVEVTCNDMGRNVHDLVKISNECNVHIIASTGFYLDEYHPNEIRKMTSEEISNIFIKELTIGIDETDIKAGVIGEVASSEKMTSNEKKVLIAAALASKKTGAAITTHCQLGYLGEEQAAIFLDNNVNPEKVILGHIDLSNDIEYMEKLLQKGFNIGFDTIGKEAYLKDELRIANLKKLILDGYGNQIVLSQDISRKSYFSICENKYGFKTVMEKFVPACLNAGITEEEIKKLLIENPRRIFNIED